MPPVGFEPTISVLERAKDSSCLRPRGHFRPTNHNIEDYYYYYYYYIAVFSIYYIAVFSIDNASVIYTKKV
jgi:hypothetical protein